MKSKNKYIQRSIVCLTLTWCHWTTLTLLIYRKNHEFADSVQIIKWNRKYRRSLDHHNWIDKQHELMVRVSMLTTTIRIILLWFFSTQQLGRHKEVLEMKKNEKLLANEASTLTKLIQFYNAEQKLLWVSNIHTLYRWVLRNNKCIKVKFLFLFLLYWTLYWI